MIRVLLGLRLVALAPLLIAAAQPSEPADCQVSDGVVDIFGEPLLLEGAVANRPVRVEAGAVLAYEALQIATRMWRTREPIVLTAYKLTYPAGVRVTALRSARGDEHCLRDALPPGKGPKRGELVPCLLDLNGDGRFEVAELIPYNGIVPFEGTRPRFRAVRTITLSTPVRLEEDPQGVGNSRIRLHRRLRIASVSTGTALVSVEHAMQSAPALISYPVSGGSPAPVPSQPVEFKPGGRRFTLRLVEDAVQLLGGMRLRTNQSGDGWTATPIDERFPRWVRYGCGGTHVEIAPVASAS